MERSRPNRSRVASIRAWSASSPARNTAGSPGVNRVTAKVTNRTPNRTGISSASRLTRKTSMEGSSLACAPSRGSGRVRTLPIRNRAHRPSLDRWSAAPSDALRTVDAWTGAEAMGGSVDAHAPQAEQILRVDDEAVHVVAVGDVALDVEQRNAVLPLLGDLALALVACLALVERDRRLGLGEGRVVLGVALENEPVAGRLPAEGTVHQVADLAGADARSGRPPGVVTDFTVLGPAPGARVHGGHPGGAVDQLDLELDADVAPLQLHDLQRVDLAGVDVAGEDRQRQAPAVVRHLPACDVQQLVGELDVERQGVVVEAERGGRTVAERGRAVVADDGRDLVAVDRVRQRVPDVVRELRVLGVHADEHGAEGRGADDLDAVALLEIRHLVGGHGEGDVHLAGAERHDPRGVFGD